MASRKWIWWSMKMKEREVGKEKWWSTGEELEGREELVDLTRTLYSCMKFSNNKI